MTSNLPQAYLEDGDFLTVFVPTIADVTKPTLDELKTPTVDLSKYLTATGFKLTHSQDFADDDREASPAVGQIPGQEKYTDGSLEVVDNTNRDDADNDAVEKLVRGTTGYIVRRRGKSHDTSFAAGDVVSVFAVTIGIKTAVAHAANARQLSTINFSTDPSSQDETATVTDTATPPAPTLKSIAVAPASGTATSVEVDKTLQLKATATYSDNSTKDVSSTAAWASDTTDNGTVDNKGLVTGKKAGKTTITAKVDDVTSPALEVDVTAAS